MKVFLVFRVYPDAQKGIIGIADSPESAETLIRAHIEQYNRGVPFRSQGDKIIVWPFEVFDGTQATGKIAAFLNGCGPYAEFDPNAGADTSTVYEWR